MSEWISMKDGMPELNAVDNSLKIGETVFAVSKDGSRYIGHFETFRFDGSSTFVGVEIDEYSVETVCEYLDASEIVNWMPLPEPPKEQTE